MARDSYIFYRSFYEAISELPKENQAETYDAIMRYALDQEEVSLSGISKAIFSLVKPQLDANYKKYENGKQGRNKTDTKQKQNGSKEEAKQKQNESKIEANVNDNVNENVNVNVNDNNNASDSCIDGLQEISSFYENNIGLITPYVSELLQDFLKEMSSEVIIYAMQISVEADKRNIKYIKAILNNWSKKGINTLVEAKKECKVKNTTKSNHETREYSNDVYESLYANNF